MTFLQLTGAPCQWFPRLASALDRLLRPANPEALSELNGENGVIAPGQACGKEEEM
jgi:hypothetical protein